ncbi:MAG: glycosyltransferase family 4 protein [Porticoccaceae bacterium]|nr:glycosyltransferase family 4 protein [Porticoccaceae bacterium]
MHILLIHQAFAALDEAGGTRHHELARHLTRSGHRVTIIASPVSYLTGAGTGRRPGKKVDDLGVTIIRSYTLPALHHSFIWRIFSFFSFMLSSLVNGLFVSRVDLVWGTTPPIFQAPTAWLLARLKGVPFLLEVRDLWPSFAVAVGVLKNKYLIRLSEGLERFLYRHADRVVVNSPGFIQHVQQRGARQVALVPNGADPDMFDPAADGSQFRVENGLEEKYVILYAGAHGISNDLDVVLDAAELLRDEPSIRIVMVGSGKEKPRLVAEAEQRQLENLLFLPPVAKQDMAATLAGADACLAILKPIEMYKTTYPNKVFDYMAAGRPVLLAIDGEIRKVVEDARAGLFVPPGNPHALADAIQAMAKDPEECRKMGVNGRTLIETRFSRAELADQFALTVDEIIKQNQG